MASALTTYGTQGQTIACTLASLASSATAGRESATIDNRTTLFLDVFVFLKVKTGAGAAANDQAVYCYVWGTVDDGTTLPDTVTGSDAAITLNSPTQLPLLGTIFTPAASTTYTSGPWSVARVFGGSMPAKWGIVVRNYEGNALDASDATMAKLYQGVYASVT